MTVTDRTDATDEEFRSRIAAFDGADEAQESLRERLIDALDAELDSLGLSQGISSRAAYYLAQTALDVVTTPVIPAAAVAAYRAAQDSGAEGETCPCGRGRYIVDHAAWCPPAQDGGAEEAHPCSGRFCRECADTPQADR